MNLKELNDKVFLICENYDKFHRFLLNLGRLFGINEANSSLFGRKPDESWTDYDRLIRLLREIKENEGKHICNLMIPKYYDDEYLDIFYRIPDDIGIRLDKLNRLFTEESSMVKLTTHLAPLKELCEMYGNGQHVRLYIEKAFDCNKQLDTKKLKVYIHHVYDNIIDIMWGSHSMIESSFINYIPSSAIVREANRAIRYASRYAWMLEMADEVNYFDSDGKVVCADEPKRTDSET